MSNLDAYWPFDQEQGQPDVLVRMHRWRKMAHLWSHWGVVSGHRFGTFGLIDTEPERILIGGGAAIVNGFYGERYNWAWVNTPGGVNGMVKVRVDLAAQTMGLFWEQWGAWHSDPNADHGVFETPLYWREADGRVVDRRYLVSPEVVPGLPDIPRWVPKGYNHVTYNANAGDVGQGGEVHATWANWGSGDPGPGRLFRATATFFDAEQVAGGFGNLQTYLLARHNLAAEWGRVLLCDTPMQLQQRRNGQGSFVFWSGDSAGSVHLAVIQSHTGGATLRYGVHSVRIEVHDCGELTGVPPPT